MWRVASTISRRPLEARCTIEWCQGERHIFVAWVVEVQLWSSSSLFFCVAIVAHKRPQLLPSGTSLQHVQCHFWRGSESAFGWDYLELAMQSQYNKRNLWATFVLGVCVVWWDIYLNLSSSPSACAGCVCAVDMRIRIHFGRILEELWVVWTKIESIIWSLFTVNIIDYRFRFLQSILSP